MSFSVPSKGQAPGGICKTTQPLQPEPLTRGWERQSPEEGKGKEGSPVTSLVPSALLSGAGALTAGRNWWPSPPQWAQSRAATGPKAQNYTEGPPLEGKVTEARAWEMGHGSKEEGMELQTLQSCRACSWKVLQAIPSEKMEPASCPGLQLFIPEMTLGGGS